MTDAIHISLKQGEPFKRGMGNFISWHRLFGEQLKACGEIRKDEVVHSIRVTEVGIEYYTEK